MNNYTRKLFNVANKIEKVMYNYGINSFEKEVNSYGIIIDIHGLNLTNFVLKQILDIVEKHNCTFYIEYDEFMKLKIY